MINILILDMSGAYRAFNKAFAKLFFTFLKRPVKYMSRFLNPLFN